MKTKVMVRDMRTGKCLVWWMRDSEEEGRKARFFANKVHLAFMQANRKPTLQERLRGFGNALVARLEAAL